MLRREFTLSRGEIVCLLVCHDAAEFEAFCTDLDRLAAPADPTRHRFHREVRRVRESGSLLLEIRGPTLEPIFRHYGVARCYLSVCTAGSDPVLLPLPSANAPAGK